MEVGRPKRLYDKPLEPGITSRLKLIAKIAAESLGLLVRHRVDQKIGGSSYRTVLPIATYSPWLDDLEFQEFYRQIRDHTLVDIYRCYELWKLVPQVPHLEGDVLEVGVWRGGTGALLAKRTANHKTVYLCDTFTGVPKAGPRDSTYRGGEHNDASEKIARDLMEELGLLNVRFLTGVFPEHTGKFLEGLRFCFAHIDVDVYDSARGALEFVWPRLSAGGILVFDDYGFATTDGVTSLVNQYGNHQDRITIHNLNGHAVVLKTKDSASLVS
jgi:O-methyltransferase